MYPPGEPAGDEGAAPLSPPFHVPNLCRYPQSKYRSPSHFAFHDDIAAMPRRDFLDECKAQAESALLASFFIAAAIELFEDPRNFVSRNSISFIHNLKPNRASPVGNADTHGRAGGAVLDRVGDKIRERLVQQQAVCVNSHAVEMDWLLERNLLPGGN